MLTTGQISTKMIAKSTSSFPFPMDNVVRELGGRRENLEGLCRKPALGRLPRRRHHSGRRAILRPSRPRCLPHRCAEQPQPAKPCPLLTQLAQRSVAAESLPDYSFITPNGCDDAHDCALGIANNWLKNNIDPLIKDPIFQKPGCLIIVFD